MNSNEFWLKEEKKKKQKEQRQRTTVFVFLFWYFAILHTNNNERKKINDKNSAIVRTYEIEYKTNNKNLTPTTLLF